MGKYWAWHYRKHYTTGCTIKRRWQCDCDGWWDLQESRCLNSIEFRHIIRGYLSDDSRVSPFITLVVEKCLLYRYHKNRLSRIQQVVITQRVPLLMSKITHILALSFLVEYKIAHVLDASSLTRLFTKPAGRTIDRKRHTKTKETRSTVSDDGTR